ncbi:MAG: hypothetical protein NUV54_03700, partial [Candidatus Taylorbacteria bacterium]|nr:hypothetical protein [Candidatus Taylorbacteria bacterium]
DRAYRGVSLETLKKYYREGGIEISAEGDEFVPGENNAGVDWYLGGFASKYGDYILEAKAKKDKFEVLPPGMSSDPLVRHLKSKGGKNGVPFSDIERVFQLEREGEEGEKRPSISARKIDIADIGKMVDDERMEADRKKLAEVRAQLGL